jgi:hypothetical protein
MISVLPGESLVPTGHETTVNGISPMARIDYVRASLRTRDSLCCRRIVTRVTAAM